MRILFIVENYIPHVGGVEVVFSQLAEGLAAKGHEVDVVTHKFFGTKTNETIKGVRIHRVSCLGSRYVFTFTSIPKALSLAKKADIIHTTTFNGAPPAFLVSKLTGKPNLITVHEVWLNFWDSITDMPWMARQLHQILEGMIYFLKFDKYVGVSKFTSKDIEKTGIPKERIETIYNALDYKLFNPKKNSKAKSRKKLNIGSEFAYFAYGRPGVSKGFEYLLKAVPEISKKIPNSKLYLMLSTNPAYLEGYKELMKLIEDLEISDKVVILNPAKREELPEYICAMDCVVVPSIREGFGYAVAEPCTMEVPVVASDCSSIPEVIFGKYLLIPPRNPKEIADAVVKISKGKYKKSPKKIFSLDENIEGYLKVYRELVKVTTPK